MDSKKTVASRASGGASAPSSLSPLRPARISLAVSSSRRSSQVSTSTDASFDADQSLSCVSRETARDDCARQRFIVWAAVKRNNSLRMTAEEKLECPLLHCTRRFSDHEAMLRHLAGCDWLASGEYWCYDHMRVERFDHVKCKPCLGYPSRRRKMLLMAKNFFHTLGHNKARKSNDYDCNYGHGHGGHGGHGYGVEPGAAKPPARATDTDTDTDTDTRTMPLINGVELPGNEIVEIDSTELETVIDPQALLIPSLPELDASSLVWSTATQWQPSSSLNGSCSLFSVGPGFADAGYPFSKPNLQVRTSGLDLDGQGSVPWPTSTASRAKKALSPSHSVRSTASTGSTDSTTSTTSTTSSVSSASAASATSDTGSLISPISDWGGAWSAPAPGETLTSPEWLSDIECDTLFSSFFELPADRPGMKQAAGTLPSFDVDVPVTSNLPYATNLGTPKLGGHDAKVCCSEAKTLVSSAWDALQEHVVSSMVKMQAIEQNRLADGLRSMSPRAMAKTGLRLLQSSFDGNADHSAVDLLCFVHLIYVFSLLLLQQALPHDFKPLFLQALAHSTSLPRGDRHLYTSLVLNIWQPPGMTQGEIVEFLSDLDSLNPKGKPTAATHDKSADDALLLSAQNFLDELESMLVMGQTPSTPVLQASDLYTMHLFAGTPAFSTATDHVRNELLRHFDSEGYGLAVNLARVGRRVTDGNISSLRRFEIEMMQAGKGCMSVERFWHGFVPRTRSLCDPLYDQLGPGHLKRHEYYSRGIQLLESLVSELDNPEVGVDLTEFLHESEMMPDVHITTPASLDIGIMRVPGLADFAGNLSDPEPISADARVSFQDANASRAPGTTAHQTQPAPPPPPPSSGPYARCDLCDYQPKGDPQWFKGSLAKHKKLQHSGAPPRIYKCGYPGCTSQYKSRPDNLRQHKIEKGHWTPGEDGSATPAASALRRPTKRRRVHAAGMSDE